MTVNHKVISGPIKSVAIIGAGPSGAGAAKAFLKESTFDRIQVYEKRESFGGLWNYTVETDVSTTPVPCESSSLDVKPVFNPDTSKYVWTSPVYDYLDTNVPKDIMTYADSKFDDDVPVFPHRSDVLRYLKNYSKELTPYIKFSTKVVEVSFNPETNKWKVVSRPVAVETEGGSSASDTKPDETEYYDAVVLAIGNYDIPYIPNREGMYEWAQKYPGTITHVKAFRNPDQFKHLTGKIVVVGNSASGGDLAYQLATYLNRPIHKSKRSENLLPAGQSDLITDVTDIAKFDAATKSLILKDGTVLEDVDAVIFATGYLKSFPFLKLPENAPPLLTDGHKVHGTYEHIILYNYTNLAIIGLTRFVLPTRTSETLGCWLSKVWSNKVTLPSVSEMKAWEEDRIKVKGNGKQFHDLLFPEDVKYNNELNRQIFESIKDLPESEKGLLPKIWDKEQTALRGSLKSIKEAYIRYKQKTGKLAQSYQELIDAKVIDQVLVTDEELKAHGFNF